MDAAALSNETAQILAVLVATLAADLRPRALIALSAAPSGAGAREAQIIHANPRLTELVPISPPLAWSTLFIDCPFTQRDQQVHWHGQIGYAERKWRTALHRFPAWPGAGTLYVADFELLPNGAGLCDFAGCDLATLTGGDPDLTDAEGVLRAAFAQMTDGVLVLDPSHRVTAWNQRFCTQLALPPAMIRLGLPFEDILRHQAASGRLGPGDPEDLTLAMLAAFTDPQRPVWEQRYADSENPGRGRVIEFRRSTQPNGGIVLLGIDVTERRRLDQALARATVDARIAHGRLVDAIAALSEGFLLFGPDEKLIVANRPAAVLLNSGDAVAPDLTLARLAALAWTGGLFPGLGSAEALLARLRAERVELEETSRQGRVLRCQISQTSDHGRVMLLSDVTELRKRERKLRDQSDLLGTLFDNMGDGLLALDADFRVILWNERVYEVPGIPKGILYRGMPVADLIRALAARGEFASAPAFANVEAHMRMIRDPEFRVSVRPRPNGRVIQSRKSMLPQGGMVLLYVDITEQRAAEDALARASEQAQAANRAKSQFLAHMSHELRTPLNAIIGFSEVIEQQMFGICGVPRYVDYAGAIGRSGRHLLDLINDILDLSRIEAGRFDLSLETLAPADLIAGALMMVSAKAERKQVALTVRQPAQLPTLRADGRALRQVLINLLDNAVKFTPSGGHVTLTISTPDAPASGVTITVADTGLGIPENKLDLVFIPFERGDERIARQEEGTGLGLPLARRLVELHGGSLTLTSVLGQGTTVTIHLPLEADADVVPTPGRSLL